MIAETVSGGRLICIMQDGNATVILLTRAEAIELLDKLPSLINEMPFLIGEKSDK